MKMLSINLWYKSYLPKTNMQLKTYRLLGYETHLFTVILSERNTHVVIYNVTDSGTEIISDVSYKNTFTPALYKKIFKNLSDYLYINSYDFVYIRRLMSKLLYAAPFFKSYSLNTKLVYELPTFPFDNNLSKIYKIRDYIELKIFEIITKYIAVIVAIPTDRSKLKKEWLVSSNYIDISNYNIPSAIPLENTLNLLIVANLARWHGYERILHAIKDYKGTYNVNLTIISPETQDYTSLKNEITNLGLNNLVTCLSQKSIAEIQKISSICHLGIGFLSNSNAGLSETSSLKHRDYSAMGLPFFTTVTDYSFKNKCPYYYQLSNMDEEINLNDIIVWFENIAKDPNYKIKMHEYAKDHLQYDAIAKEILDRIGLKYN